MGDISPIMSLWRVDIRAQTTYGRWYDMRILPDERGSMETSFSTVENDTRYTALVATIGFSCFWGCALIVLASPGFSFLSNSAACAAYLIGAVAGCLLASSPIADRLSQPPTMRRTRIIAAVLAGMCVALLHIAESVLPLPGHLLLALALGALLGGLLVTWGTLWTAVDSVRPDTVSSARSVAGSFSIACLLALFAHFAPAGVSALTALVLLAASAILQIHCSKLIPSPEEIDRNTSRSRLRLLSRNLLIPFAVGCCLGVTLCLIAHTEPAALRLPAVFAGVFVGSVGVLATLGIARHVPRLSSIERVAFAAACGILLVLPHANSILAPTLLGALVAALTLFHVSHWNVLVELSYHHRLQTVFHYAQGLIAPLGGIALGWIAACAALLAGEPLSSAILPSACAFLLMLVACIAPFTSNTAVETLWQTDESPQDDGAASGRKPWHDRCDSIAQRAGLTPREKEVFELLAKGRNTDFISKSLFITSHTVKTHTSRIYRKLEINSHQELIDLVDEEGSKDRL